MTTHLSVKSLKKLNEDCFSLNLTFNLFNKGLYEIFVNIFKYNTQYLSATQTKDINNNVNKFFNQDILFNAILRSIILPARVFEETE